MVPSDPLKVKLLAGIRRRTAQIRAAQRTQAELLRYSMKLYGPGFSCS